VLGSSAGLKKKTSEIEGEALWRRVLQHSKRLRISLMARRFGDVSMMWFCGCGSAFMPLCMPAHKAHRMCERIDGWQGGGMGGVAGL